MLRDALADGGERRRQHDEGCNSDGQVDVEDPAPRERGREEATEQRSDHARKPEHSPEQPLVAAALARRDDIADRRHRPHHQAAAAEPLDRAERHQLRQALRQAAQRRADQEQDERELQHDLAAEHVAELPVDGHHRRLREQVGGDHPRDVIEPAEVADDRRQRRGDDRLIERRHQHHQHQPGEDDEHAVRIMLASSHRPILYRAAGASRTANWVKRCPGWAGRALPAHPAAAATVGRASRPTWPRGPTAGGRPGRCSSRRGTAALNTRSPLESNSEM